ncbi:protein GVQW3 isoform X1 [Cryptotermes secundus]|uniref:protein GVQW3 isoform X1 n=1 Tax=Cryptotermes secundus TaxID=105785 RepID=UPI000CD7B944|nr:protein GVQW3 isoform X1 [Cryptotermes secundus]
MLGLELEQRTNIKFLVKLGKSKSEIREMLVKVYGDNAMKKTAVHKWAKRFSAGRESVTDEERSGRPATSRTGKNIAKVRQIVRENCRLTVRGIAQQAKIDRETVRKILTEDLDMRKIKGQHSVRKRQRPTSTPSATTALLTKSETSLVSPNQQPYVEATTTTQTGYGPGSDEGANTPPFPIGCPHRATARQIVTITTEHLKQGLQQ